MITHGFYAVPRWLQEHPVRRDCKTWSVLHFCLSQASWRDVYSTEWGEVRRGQLITSIQSIQEVTAISTQSIRTSLKKLEKCKFLTIKTTNKCTILSLDYKELKLNLPDAITSQLTNNQQTTNKQLTTSEDVRSKRNKKTTPSSGDDGSGLLFPEEPPKKAENVYREILNGKFDDFVRFWDLYPRSASKKDAATAYVKAREIVPAGVILTGLERALPELKSREEKNIPHAATWLNGMRWEDAPSSHVPTTPEIDYPVLGKKK